MMKLDSRHPFTLFAATLLIFSTTARGFDYTITDIGLIPGNVTSFANGLNNQGEVVGYYTNAGVQTAFVYSGGVFTSLGVVGDLSSGAYGINEAGTIVGTQRLANFTRNAFIQSSGGRTNVADGTIDIYGAAINGSGTIVGSFGPSNEFQAYSSNGGSKSNLGTLGGLTASARGINDAGMIVGESKTVANDTHAFSYLAGAMTDLGTLGGNYSTAYGINATGTIVGSSSLIDGGAGHAFSFTTGVMTDLGTLGGASSTALAINASGWIVGGSQLANSSQAGFIYKNGSLLNLSNLVNGQTIFNATGINDYGQITALGTVNGFTHALLLTPTAPTVVVAGSDLDARLASGLGYDQIQDFTDPQDGNTTVSFLGGVAGANRNIEVSFGAGGNFAASSVVDVSGMGGDTYVLQLSYDPAVAIALFGSEENARLMWFDGVAWVNAVDGNVGGIAHFVNGAFDSSSFSLGDYGVDVASNEVWAVINHNSLFAVAVPEPSSIALIGLAFGTLIFVRRTRK